MLGGCKQVSSRGSPNRVSPVPPLNQTVAAAITLATAVSSTEIGITTAALAVGNEHKNSLFSFVVEDTAQTTDPTDSVDDSGVEVTTTPSNGSVKISIAIEPFKILIAAGEAATIANKKEPAKKQYSSRFLVADAAAFIADNNVYNIKAAGDASTTQPLGSSHLNHPSRSLHLGNPVTHRRT